METEDLVEPEQEQIESTSEETAIEASTSLDSIFEGALKGKADSPEDVKPTEEIKPLEQAKQPAQKQVVSTPYGEITLDEAKKIRFKSEGEFKAFLDRNPFLKDRVLMQSDYTRKTAQVAEERKKFTDERKQFEQEQAKQSEAWGQTKPQDEDMSFFHNTWHLFQHGSDQLASRIQAFARDISLVTKGQPPVGPLAGQNGESHDFSRDSQIVSVKRELETLRQEQARRETETKTQETARLQEEASREVQGWLKAKADAGNPVTDEERNVMADFSQVKKADGTRYSLDELHRIALAQLGKTEKAAINKVFTGAKTQSVKTGLRPNSRASSGAKPGVDTNDLGSILNNGLESLKE